MTSDRNKISETIIAMELAINERWNRGDIDGALEVYAENVTYFDPLTEKRLDGRAVVASYFRQFFEGKLNILRNELLYPAVTVSDAGDMAVATYNLLNYLPDGEGGEKPGAAWNSTQVYSRIDGAWRVVHVNWSFTRLPAAMQMIMS